jgi:hypothetical protein
MFGRKSIGVERIIVFLPRGLAIFGYFYMRFHIDNRIIIFRTFLSIRYSWEIFDDCRDLSK